MRLNACASSPTSSAVVTATSWPGSPAAIALATAAISRSGAVVPRASSAAQPSASRLPVTAPTGDGRPAVTAATVVAAVTRIVTRMTMPNLSFSDGSSRSTTPC